MLGCVLVRQPTVILRVPALGERRMLGCVHGGQPTVILRVGATFCANTWTHACSRQATDRHLEKVSAVRKVNAWICASLTTDHDPASVIPDRKRKSVTTAIFADLMFFELISPVTIFCNF